MMLDVGLIGGGNYWHMISTRRKLLILDQYPEKTTDTLSVPGENYWHMISTQRKLLTHDPYPEKTTDTWSVPRENYWLMISTQRKLLTHDQYPEKTTDLLQVMETKWSHKVVSENTLQKFNLQALTVIATDWIVRC